MRRLYRLGALLLLVPLSAIATGQGLRFNIPAQPLPEALRSFADQARMQLLYSPEAVSGGKSNPVIGEFDQQSALAMLLKDTGYEAVFSRGNAATVRKVTWTASQPPSRAQSEEGSKRLSQGGPFRLAQAGEGAAAQSATAVGGPQPSPLVLEEVVVTAEKRTERLQDVPIPVSVLSGESLTTGSQLRIQDYYASVPGLNVSPANQSAQFLTIRGLNTGGFQNPLVGVVIDDVPFGSSTNLGGGYAVPDIDPSDLQRVEVLRGPQGTLYGANSMGGLVKFVTREPSPTAGLTGHIEAGTDGVHDGSEPGYNFRASANVPLTDTLAIRASAFTREDPGYIDNPHDGVKGVNEARYSGGRLAALWAFSDSASLSLSSLYQVARGDGGNFAIVKPALGDLQLDDAPGLDAYRREVQAYSATLRVKLGVGELTAISGYNVNSFTDSEDVTFFGPDIAGPHTGLAILNNNRTSKLSQELRYSTPLGSRLDLVGGLFYTHEDSSISQSIPIIDTNSGQSLSLLEAGIYPTTYQERAAFADITVHFTDRLDLQIGGRESKIKQTQGPDETFPGPAFSDKYHADSSAFTYLFTPRLELAPNQMLYARLASGYRPGGINVLPFPGAPGYAPNLPRQYDPDKTRNYEVGFKGDFLQHVVSVDGSVYYIDWTGIQLSELSQNIAGYTANGSSARSRGMELSVDARPLQGLTVSTWGSLNDATLTRALPPTSAVPGYGGEQLPYSTRFSAHASATEEFPLAAHLTGFVTAEVSYVGQRLWKFSAAPLTELPAYAQTNLRAGARYQDWDVRLYANNVTDRRGVLGQDANPLSWYYIQPRTVGLAVGWTF